MGNCQAIDATTVVIQHPGGGVERLYWPITTEEVIKNNPNHYLGLVTLCCLEQQDKRQTTNIRITRVKILRPKDPLLPGQIYRLIPSKDVMKGLEARKHRSMKKNHEASLQRKMIDVQGLESVQETRRLIHHSQEELQERQRPTTSVHSVTARSRQWRPSLQSISELGS